VKAVYKGEMN